MYGMERHLKVRGVAILDGKLLCVRLKPYPGAAHFNKDFWCLPGGSVDSGEAITDAFKREMVEELGVEPKVGRLLYVQQFTHNNKEYVEFFLHIENPQDYTDIDLSKTTHGDMEIEELAFVDPKTTYVLPEFLSAEPLAEFIASHQHAKFFTSDN